MQIIMLISVVKFNICVHINRLKARLP